MFWKDPRSQRPGFSCFAYSLALLSLPLGLVAQQPRPVSAQFSAPTRTSVECAPDETPIDRRVGKIVELDAAKNTLVLETEEDQFKLTVEIGSATQLTVARQAVKVSELRVGMEAAALFKGEAKVPFKIEAGWPRVEAKVKALDLAKRTISIPLDSDRGIDADLTLNLRADVEVLFDGILAGLEDVLQGESTSLELAVDKKTVAGLHVKANKNDIPAHCQSVGVDRKSLIVRLEANNEKANRSVEIGFGVSDQLKVRILGKDAELADLKPNMPLVLRTALDRRTLTHIWAGAPEIRVDDDK